MSCLWYTHVLVLDFNPFSLATKYVFSVKPAQQNPPNILILISFFPYIYWKLQRSLRAHIIAFLHFFFLLKISFKVLKDSWLLYLQTPPLSPFPKISKSFFLNTVSAPFSTPLLLFCIAKLWMILAAGHEVVRFSGQVGGECGKEERDVQMFKPGFFFF